MHAGMLKEILSHSQAESKLKKNMKNHRDGEHGKYIQLGDSQGPGQGPQPTPDAQAGSRCRSLS
jgi:hypothetical protein